MAIPAFTEFSPASIRWQGKAHNKVIAFDYSTGILEWFCSGGVGSAKTSVQIHELVADMIEQPNSVALMVRRALKDLKRTSWAELLKHIRDIPHLIKSYNKSELKIEFINGSIIMGDSYDDGDETKFQSLNLSHLDIEEGNEMPQAIYQALKLRVGRAGVAMNRIQIRCNPDSPSHWLYKYFIQDADHPCKQVDYSLTKDNKFLPPWYFENLQRDLDPKMARRKLYGEWIEIGEEGVYYNYLTSRNFVDKVYEWDIRYPISIMHDFNIGHGKPMSAAIGQHINGVFHVAKTFIIEGLNTPKLMDEIASTGLFEIQAKFQVYGDAAGKHKDTRNSQSDYDIIEKFLTNFVRKDGTFLEVEMNVPLSNPAIRTRHNKMNTLFCNDLGEVRFYVYKDAKDLDEGLRLTKLKKGAHLVEDDSFRLQHVTTAVGYWICYIDTYGDVIEKVNL